MAALHAAWGESLSFGAYYTPSASNRYYSFRASGDIFTPEQQKAWNAMQKAANETRDAFRSLLKHVRASYTEIDLEQTSQDAWLEFAEFRKRNDDASDASIIESAAAAAPLPATEADGLRAHDVAILAILMAEDGVSFHRLQFEMEKAGFAKVATGIGVVKLRRLQFIMYKTVRQGDPDNEFSEQQLILTSDGIDWLINNQEKVQLQAGKSAPT
jgi:hypothetical protein